MTSRLLFPGEQRDATKGRKVGAAAGSQDYLHLGGAGWRRGKAGLAPPRRGSSAGSPPYSSAGSLGLRVHACFHLHNEVQK